MTNIEIAALGLLHFSAILSDSEAFWFGRAQITCFGSPITRISIHQHLFRARPIDKCKNIVPYVFTILNSFYMLSGILVWPGTDFMIRELSNTHSIPEAHFKVRSNENCKTVALRFLFTFLKHFWGFEAFWCCQSQITSFGSPVTHIPMQKHIFRASHELRLMLLDSQVFTWVRMDSHTFQLLAMDCNAPPRISMAF